MSDNIGPTDRSRFRWRAAVPLLAAALCLPALLPILLYAPVKSDADFVVGKGIAVTALVGYPILLLGLLLTAIWAKERGRLRAAPFRIGFWLLQAAFVIAIAAAIVLMFA